METVNIRFNSMEVEKADLRRGILDIAFHYDEKGKASVYRKAYSMDNDMEKFIQGSIKEILQKAREKHGIGVDDDDNFLNYYINIIIENESSGEKMVNAIKRFREKVKSLKSVGRHESYIQRYNSLLGLKADIK